MLVNPNTTAAVERIEAWRTLGNKRIKTIINLSERVKNLHELSGTADLSADETADLAEAAKNCKSRSILVQENLIRFDT